MRPSLAVILALCAPGFARADDAALAARGEKAKLLDDAAAALSDFDPERAIVLLEKAKASGPWGWADYARLYEQLGIAYAYLEKPEPTAAAFDMLLTIDPARALSYTLSPKVTFLFEKARQNALQRPPNTLQVTWRADLKIAEEVPIDVEVIEDPMGLMKQGVLGWRLAGTPSYETVRFDLPPKGQRHTEILPPPAPASKTRERLEIYVAALDAEGNEVLLWGSPNRPREVMLDFDAPTPWYGSWWVWTIAGVVVAGAATTAAVLVTREPGPTVSGTFGVSP